MCTKNSTCQERTQGDVLSLLIPFKIFFAIYFYCSLVDDNARLWTLMVQVLCRWSNYSANIILSRLKRDKHYG